MTHPTIYTSVKINKEVRCIIYCQNCLSIFSSLRSFNFPFEIIHNYLVAVTDSKNRYSKFKYLSIRFGRIFSIYTSWATRKNYTIWRKLFNLISGEIIRINFTKNICISYSYTYKMAILRSKI